MRLIEENKLAGEPKDIGQLLIMIQRDIGEECKEEIWGLHWQGYDIPSIAVLLGIPEDKVVDSLKEKARVRIRQALEQHDVQAYVDARNWLWRLMG